MTSLNALHEHARVLEGHVLRATFPAESIRTRCLAAIEALRNDVCERIQAVPIVPTEGEPCAHCGAPISGTRNGHPTCSPECSEAYSSGSEGYRTALGVQLW